MSIRGRIIVGILFLCAAILTCATSFAQGPKVVQATIPFDFWIAGNRLPGGVYQIEHIESSAYIFFRSTDGKAGHDAYTLPLDEIPAGQRDAKLVFRLQDGKYCLYEGWGPYGRRLVTTEAASPEPTGKSRVEIPLVYR
jgi:hypothetical protein